MKTQFLCSHVWQIWIEERFSWMCIVMTHMQIYGKSTVIFRNCKLLQKLQRLTEFAFTVITKSQKSCSQKELRIPLYLVYISTMYVTTLMASECVKCMKYVSQSTGANTTNMWIIRWTHKHTPSMHSDSLYRIQTHILGYRELQGKHCALDMPPKSHQKS